MATWKSALKPGAVDAAIEACKAGGKKIELKGEKRQRRFVVTIMPHQRCQHGGMALLHTTDCNDEVAIAVAVALKSWCSHVTHVTLQGEDVRAHCDDDRAWCML